MPTYPQRWIKGAERDRRAIIAMRGAGFTPGRAENYIEIE
jgi:hypothetical protein